ncbi:Pathogenesis-related thaumatin superfamily protein [Perilla frutescens var. hirtella]|uniref:Pathogenesis-related thaumatin superfamily protein n=1 Tax=Perilla frutescens var. hirtella TaxID=608512 RepID=A0AAD4PDT3_PERFH|nr:Pathogenesis-related thaumatin superfamily protein [Perilla frutescens var. hirtella]
MPIIYNAFLLFSLYIFTTIFISCHVAHGHSTHDLIIVNNCTHHIWPAFLGNTGQPPLHDGGFHLHRGHHAVVEAPKWWSGRMWARQGCHFNETGKGWCQTGDCDGQLRCMGAGEKPPATVIELTLGTHASPTHFYDVSVVDGFNLPVSVVPEGGPTAGCRVAACAANLNVCCPNNLVVRRRGKVVGCKSACLGMGSDEYCCRGKYGSPQTCKPSPYSKFFKDLCPKASSYAFDEPTALDTCIAKKYVITFCPSN